MNRHDRLVRASDLTGGFLVGGWQDFEGVRVVAILTRGRLLGCGFPSPGGTFVCPMADAILETVSDLVFHQECLRCSW